MDHLKMGSFIAELRKGKNMTQRELADRLHVTDKAVSKWETGKGFPDVKILEPLAQELDVSLVELLKGERQQSDTITVEEAGQVVVRAMDQSERSAARKYLYLFRWLLTGICVWCALDVMPYVFGVSRRFWHELMKNGSVGIIGGADGPTPIIVGVATMPPLWQDVGIPVVVFLLGVVLAVRVRKLEKRLK